MLRDQHQRSKHDEVLCACTGICKLSIFNSVCNDAELQTAQFTNVEDINLIQWHNRAGSTLTLTAESGTPPGINCSLVGKADSGVLCQGVTQCRLETSVKTQVTDAALVKAGGVHFAMTVSEWSINFQNLPAGLRVREAGQTLR